MNSNFTFVIFHEIVTHFNTTLYHNFLGFQFFFLYFERVLIRLVVYFLNFDHRLKSLLPPDQLLRPIADGICCWPKYNELLLSFETKLCIFIAYTFMLVRELYCESHLHLLLGFKALDNGSFSHSFWRLIDKEFYTCIDSEVACRQSGRN